MSFTKYIPDDIQEKYEIHDYRHAAAILANEYPEEFEQICIALREFRLTIEDIKKKGGNESDIPKKISSILRPLGWEEGKLSAKTVVNDTELNVETHKIDYVKERVAFDLEWNSKDQTFDRDLYAFRAFFDYNRISVGVLFTRSTTLDPLFKSLGKDADGKKYSDKYGASTTHLGKLLYRLDSGRNGGCPVLVIGITPNCVDGIPDIETIAEVGEPVLAQDIATLIVPEEEELSDTETEESN
ncbi:MAG: hypothetical protein JWP57_4344 [Spirosoma sp.]|nr:hypothetical protein [Spirosoma sp.]